MVIRFDDETFDHFIARAEAGDAGDADDVDAMIEEIRALRFVEAAARLYRSEAEREEGAWPEARDPESLESARIALDAALEAIGPAPVSRVLAR